MKQSSIEWFENNLKSLISEDGAIYDFKLNVVELFQQAKEMHKQEIIEAYNEGYRTAEIDCGEISTRDIAEFTNAEDYYKDTYEKEQN